MKHNRIVSFFKTPLFIAKEYLHRRHKPGFNWQFVSSSESEEAAKHSETLESKGIVLLPAYVEATRLGRVQKAFEEAVDGKTDKANPEGLINSDFLHLNPAFLDIALDPFLLQIISGYYRKPFAIGAASAQRLDPMEANRYGSYQWHHDCRGRQVHMMVLLNDVPASGQRMSYLAGTHHQYYDHFRGLSYASRYESDVVSNKYAEHETVELAGPAGTVGIFDSNGLHTGNRNPNGRRDCLTMCYVSHRHWKPVTYKQSDVEGMPDQLKQVIAMNPRHKLVP